MALGCLLAIQFRKKHSTCSDYPIVTTGCWNINTFKSAERLTQKKNLIKAELPDVSRILTVESFSSVHGMLTNLNIPFASSHDDPSKYLKSLKKSVKTLKSRHDTAYLDLNHVHGIEKIPIPEKCADKKLLYESLHRGFSILMNTFRFEHALKAGNRIHEIIQTNCKGFEVQAIQFYPRYVVLLTALYRFEEAKTLGNNLNFNNEGLEKRALSACLVAESAMLRRDFTFAETLLSEHEKFLQDNQLSRFEVYKTRLLVDHHSIDNRESLLTGSLEKYLAVRPDRTRDLVYWYYGFCRLLNSLNRFTEVIDVVKEAENECGNDDFAAAWPGILWRREGAKAAYALKQTDLASAWLTKPLPESLQDRFVLHVHQSASLLLNWMMTSSKYDETESPESICQPFFNEHVRNHFENNVNDFLDCWKRKESRESLCTAVKGIVDRSYE